MKTASLYLDMLTKEKLIHAVNQLPEEFSIDDVLNELLLIQKMEKGLVDQENKDVISR